MTKVIGVINDLHIPFHDERATNLVLDAFEDIGIDELVINGDLLDMFNISMHGPKNPDIKEMLEDEIYAGRDFLKDISKRFEKVTYLYGNHSWRLDRYILKNAPAFWNLCKLDKMLELDRLGIKWLPYQKEYQVEKCNLFIQHSPPSYSENLAMTSLKKKIGASFIFGCSHRLDFACKTSHTGELLSVYANGCLVDMNSPVFSYTKGHHNWQHGGCLVYADKKDFFVNQFMIKNYKLALNGFLYEG